MKNIKNMTYKELENEVSQNRSELATANQEQKRVLIRRNHELMTEMDGRWNQIKDWWK